MLFHYLLINPSALYNEIHSDKADKLTKDIKKMSTEQITQKGKFNNTLQNTCIYIFFLNFATICDKTEQYLNRKTKPYKGPLTRKSIKFCYFFT